MLPVRSTIGLMVMGVSQLHLSYFKMSFVVRSNIELTTMTVSNLMDSGTDISIVGQEGRFTSR